MGFRLKCSECKGKFPWEGDWPSHCPLCGIDMSLPDDNVISMPALRSAVTGMHDKVYRDMERGAEHRVQLASEALGVPASELSHLKITNMRDNTREGEIAAIEDTAPLKRLQASAQSGQDFFKANGSELGPGIASGDVTVNGQTVRGIAPRAGATAMQQIKRQFGG